MDWCQPTTEQRAVWAEWVASRPSAVRAVAEGLGSPREPAMLETFAPPHDERWIEVWPGDDCLDVMTRLSDDFTTGVAYGLARTFAIY